MASSGVVRFSQWLFDKRVMLCFARISLLLVTCYIQALEYIDSTSALKAAPPPKLWWVKVVLAVLIGFMNLFASVGRHLLRKNNFEFWSLEWMIRCYEFTLNVVYLGLCFASLWLMDSEKYKMPLIDAYGTGVAFFGAGCTWYLQRTVSSTTLTSCLRAPSPTTSSTTLTSSPRVPSPPPPSTRYLRRKFWAKYPIPIPATSTTLTSSPRAPSLTTLTSSPRVPSPTTTPTTRITSPSPTVISTTLTRSPKAPSPTTATSTTPSTTPTARITSPSLTATSTTLTSSPRAPSLITATSTTTPTAKTREKEGVAERPDEAAAQRQREVAADVYGAFDMRVDRHWSEKKFDEMTERDWRIFREDFNISYKGSKIPRPMRNWAESKLTPELLTAVEKVGYKKPSPIQMAAIPLGLQQRDVIGIVETGSGKTAAFVLPMLAYILRLPPMSEENEAEGPYAVVMTPTRELAQQIEDETLKFAHYLGIKVVSIVGGQSIEEQGFKIRQGCEVVIATPGRLIDCLERRCAVLNQCNCVVLDEADRMIDMGFEPQVVEVLEAMPSSNLKSENEDEELDEKRIYRTTYMFSATMPPAVERLARKYLRNPVVVTIGTAGKATDLITQHVIMLKESEKMSRLQKLLSDLGEKTAIVFINTKKSADFLSKSLDKSGFHVTTLHGGKSQEQREISLEGFRNKRFNVLVATDVAGRGIDIPDVAHVINYDMPAIIEMYTHRIGRTGRAGKTGVATTFLTLHDTDVFYDLKKMLIQSNSPVPPELARHEASKFKPGTIPDRPPRRNETLFTH